MKKRIALVLAIILIASIFVGCAKQAVEPQKEVGNESNDIVTDVLVIGGGGAGLVSAITAAENGANVILVEKMPMLGGNTIISATGLTASDTALHEEAGIPFTVEDHIARTMDMGKDLPDLELVTILAEESNTAYEWLVSLGLSYKLNEEEPWWIIPTEGHYGSQLVNAYVSEATKQGVDVRLETKATELVTEDGKVVGAKVVDKDGKELDIKANAVILATGGFGNAGDLIGEYNPNYAGAHSIMSTAGPTGDGFRMAVEVGAGMRDMEFHQMRPLATPGYWIRESVISEEGIGGILVNKDGARFANETLKPLDLVPEILAQKDRVGYVIFDADVFETKNGTAAVGKGKMIQTDTIEELAEALGLNAEAVGATVAAYNEGQDEFGRETMGKVTKAPFYGVQVAPSSHYTMAGITINADTQVTDENGEAIEGLYAAGEIVGGLYGSGRVAGNNTTENIVFGKRAGKHAAGK
ncbi:fumarate reductase flavoprotein subunit [Anaerovirgula multivorans]|uniref:Fumarate reductase flavoprotein subunit n=1 Tax=Anaerovirgula multivorans TaxID=312168 RepID=A0A239BA04_9FIRM|nr:flavocytochrome c [Anaerovirgula multivorans]SNS04776.1 fumarate reductase flavoprotein subunit [Anaerovirgula multivorans]